MSDSSEAQYSCPMCSGSGERHSARTGRLVDCTWCGARGLVALEKRQWLIAQLKTKRARAR